MNSLTTLAFEGKNKQKEQGLKWTAITTVYSFQTYI